MFIGLLVQSRPKVRTLQDQLRIRGIPVIPLNRVGPYMARVWAEDTEQGSHWERVDNLSDPVLDTPPDMHVRAGLAKAIPGVEVYAERFREDPFLFASRKRLFRKDEVCCIGNWNTPGFEG